MLDRDETERGAAVAPAYQETLRPPVGWWLLGLGFAVVVGWIFLVATMPLIGLAALLITAGLVVAALWWYGSPVIVAGPDGLRAGRGTLPARYIAAVTPLDQARTTAAFGPECDPRAFLVLRTYCRTAVRVDLDDPRDPAPYWLISTRRPERVVAALAEVVPEA